MYASKKTHRIFYEWFELIEDLISFNRKIIKMERDLSKQNKIEWPAKNVDADPGDPETEILWKNVDLKAMINDNS